MISIVLYGRNDSYGYNLHKRAALSLNCMAEVLTDPSDEILFVDYNTPDDFPTFPEAIQDTLTRRAKEMLRIFRVRPRVHDRFRSKTRLLALEPIARNVAVRRSSASNRWILSTNTDMIFVPLHERSLSRLAQHLAPGFYHTPRLEIPEVLWESLKRSDPVGVIETVRTWGSSLHLNEIVLGSKIILYDGPGDFQLLLRSDLFENQGFDEEMLLGWHVDSNIAARMHLKYGRVGDLGCDVYGYHCDHTRQVTPAHSHARLQNDWRKFVTEITRPDIPSQTDNWGCVEEDIEEIRLGHNPASIYAQALHEGMGESLGAPNVVTYESETYNGNEYDPRHILPFLADLFAPMRRNTNLAWYGAQSKTLILFANVWEKLGFTGKILVDSTALWTGLEITAISHASESAALAEANAFLFDFCGLSGLNALEPMRLRKSFLLAVRTERKRISSGEMARRFIALNAIKNDYEAFVSGFIAAAETPLCTHLRHGFVFPAAKEEWLPLLSAGEAGGRVGAQIKSDPEKNGWIAYGPHKYLDMGRYGVACDIELPLGSKTRPTNEPCVCIEVRAGSQLLALRLLRFGDLGKPEHRLEFALSQGMAGVSVIEMRIATLTPIAVALRKISVELLSPLVEIDPELPDILRIHNWIPYLRIGPLGQFNESAVIARIGLPGFVAFGPYWSLPAGTYELTAFIEYQLETTDAGHLVRVDVAVGNRQLVAGNFQLTTLPSDAESAMKILRLRFNLEDPTPEERQIETRIWSSGEEQFTVNSLSVREVDQHNSEDLLPLLLIGEAGQRIGGEIRNADKRMGFVVYSPTIALQPGTYKLSHLIVVQKECNTPDRDNYPCAFLIVKQGPYILAIDAISSSASQGENRSIYFGITSRSNQPSTVEFLLQAVQPVDVRLRVLAIEPATVSVPSTELAAFQITNWLPFMQKLPGVQTDLDGFVVNEGTTGFVFWGPYWTLPAGHYEVITVVVPPLSNSHGEPLLTLDVSSESGQHLIAQHQWRLGQVLLADSQKTLECRLPFEVGDDLPTQSRTIEARVSTLGSGSFHLRSLRVQPISTALDLDLFCYLTVRDCGVHAGNAIRSLENRTGCIACTPPLYVEAGRYEARLSLVDGLTGRSSNTEGEVGLEIRSRLDILASGTCKLGPGSGANEILTFDIARDLAADAHIELAIQATSPAVVSIDALHVIKLSDDVPTRLEPFAGNLWADRIRIGSVGHATRKGVQARAGLTGLVGYVLAPYRTGRCEIVLRIKRADQRGDASGHLTVSSGDVVLASRSFDFRPNPIPRGPFRFCSFVAPIALARRTATIQIRIDSTGVAPFLVQSIVLTRRTRLGDMRDWAQLAARRILSRLRRVCVK